MAQKAKDKANEVKDKVVRRANELKDKAYQKAEDRAATAAAYDCVWSQWSAWSVCNQCYFIKINVSLKELNICNCLRKSTAQAASGPYQITIATQFTNTTITNKIPTRLQTQPLGHFLTFSLAEISHNNLMTLRVVI